MCMMCCLTLHSMIAMYNIHMIRQSLQCQYPTFHRHLIVYIGMLSLGKLLAFLFFDDFECKYFVGSLVLTDYHGGKVAIAKGGVRVGGFVGT